MDNKGQPAKLFAKLSPRVAQTLADHLFEDRPKTSSVDGRAALFLAWHSQHEARQRSLLSLLFRMEELSVRRARSYVLEHARVPRSEGSPVTARLLDAISTPDLAVRLYLDDPVAFEHAYLKYVTEQLDQVAIYQGQYVADVVPSYDRRARMREAMLAAARQDAGPLPVRDRVSEPGLNLTEFVADDRFALVLHRGATLKEERAFDQARALAPDLRDPQIKVAILFRFDASTLAVKAQADVQRETLRRAFTRIFVSDPRYFDTPRDRKARVRLTISGEGATRPRARSAIAQGSSAQ